jgi:hypothetical protein
MIVHGEFNDPNFGFAESCTKKNALNKLAKMSKVRHNAKSIEHRYNWFKIFTKLFDTKVIKTRIKHIAFFVSAKQYICYRKRTVPYRVLAHSHSPTSLYNFNYVSQSTISLHELFTSCPHLTCERASFGLV